MLRPALALAVLLITGCATSSTYVDRPPPPPDASGETAHTILVAGGLDALRDPAALRTLGADARAAGPQTTVVLLGIVPPTGASDPVPEIAAALSGFTGRVMVVPGSYEPTASALQSAAARLGAALGIEVDMPVGVDRRLAEVDLLETLRLVVLDTSWWLADGGGAGGAGTTRSDVTDRLEQLVADRDDEQLVVVGAHPLYSNGAAGGYAGLRGVATLGVGPVLAQTVGTDREHLAAPTYRAMRRALLGAFGAHERLLYAGALDASLQAFQRPVNAGRERQTFLVGGSTGGATEPTVGGRGAQLAAPRPGYWRLRYRADGTLDAEAVALSRGGPEPVWRVQASPPAPELVPDRLPDSAPPPPGPATVTQPSDAGFDEGRIGTGPFLRAVAGDTYRNAWRAPVTVPTLDLDVFAGGLTPVRRGGGNQTTSLRLSGADGFDYDLRLIEKGGSGGLPPALADGVAGDLVSDLRSSVIPYGAAVATELSWAAGLRSPRPDVVFVPDDPRLGRYRAEFGGHLATIEVQPDDDMSGFPGWDDVTDVVSGQKLREEMREDQDHRVDQAEYLRARLVDLLVADWDRHAGQWRWAAYEPGEIDASLSGDATTAGKVYRPIPGDRDWAFYNPGGPFQRILFQANRRHQPFTESYGSLSGLTFEGRFQDRRFLNELPADSVRAIAQALCARITDAEIDRALATLPPAVAAEVADDWRRALRARRDRLTEAAMRLYQIVARDVDVPGSDEDEWFVAEPAAGGLRVTVYGDDDGARGRRLYVRTFQPSETNEVRLYGLGGTDRFDLRAEGTGIHVRAVGGAARDLVQADGSVRVYDVPGGVQVDPAATARLSDSPDIGRYDEHAPYRRVRVVSPVLGANATDGLVLGAAVTTTTQGFRLAPFAARHTVSADVATATGGLRAAYNGRFQRLRGPGLALDLLAASPRVARNFYGLGNGARAIPADAARLSVARVEASARLTATPGERVTVSAGPAIRYADPGRGDDLDDETSLALPVLPDGALEGQTHAGITARLALSTADAVLNPRQGVSASAHASALAGVTGPAAGYGSLGARLAAYVPLRLEPQLTLALRAGAQHRLGTPPLYDTATLGQGDGLRGFRDERFTGTTAASASAELRARLGRVQTYLAPLDIGVLAFGDGGRVWARDGAVSGAPDLTADGGSELHAAVGGGLWLGVLDSAILVTTVQRSSESTLVSLGLGFDF